MGEFEDFITLELPKRPFALDDGAPGQIPVRSENAARRLELVWIDTPSAKISTDEGNQIKAGSDEGLFVPQFEWTTTQW